MRDAVFPQRDTVPPGDTEDPDGSFPPSARPLEGEHARRAEAWFSRRTSDWRDWPLPQLMSRKHRQGTRISVVIPARNEERTVGDVVSAVRAALMAEVPLVDELVVMDSDSTDATAEVARRAGATVHRCREVEPELGAYPGKGEALWKSLFVTDGDILVFLDADLTRWGTHFVTGLLGPLLADGEVRLVKGCYERLRASAGGDVADGVGGGRVTELVARPLLNLWWPELAGVAQPLAGEWATRRDLLESLAVPVGYGVELAVLIDTAARFGVGAVAQVDLGERAHRHQSDADLGIMAAELLVVAERRRLAGSGGLARGDARATPEPRTMELLQFVREGGELRKRPRLVPTAERPLARSVRAAAAR
jgi:glucosyl-3-phosphoglycerate synthase